MCNTQSICIFFRLAVVAGLIIISGGCATYDMKPMPELPQNRWNISKQQSDVSVSAEKYVNPKEKSYPFGKNLNKKSVLPVRVMVVNHGSEVVMVRPDQISLGDTANQYHRLNVKTVHDRIMFSPFGHYMAWACGIGIPTAGAGLLPGVIVGFAACNKAELVNRNIREDLYDKSFGNRILRREEKADGFLFFDVPKDRHSGSFRLSVGVLSTNGSLMSVDLVLPPSRE